MHQSDNYTNFIEKYIYYVNEFGNKITSVDNHKNIIIIIYCT